MINDQRRKTTPKSAEQKTVIVNRRAGPTIVHLPMENGQIPAISLAPGRNTPQTLAEAETAKNPVKKLAQAAAERMGSRMDAAAKILTDRHPSYLERNGGDPAILEVK